MKVLFQFIFYACNLLLSLLYVVLYPFLYLILSFKHYHRTLQVSPPAIPGGILIHAASVGEVNAVKPLILALLNRYQNLPIYVTTNTITGQNIARGISNRLVCDLSVLDFLHLRLKQFRTLKPSLCIVVETEVWFNMLFSAGVYKVPVIFVNARISQKTLDRFKPLLPLLKWLQNPIHSICAQSEEHSKRFRKIFDVPILNCGNLKYAVDLPKYDINAIRKAMHYNETDFVICFGSSRPGEEELLKQIYPDLLAAIPALKIIIAIRHLNRTEEVINLFKTYSPSLQSTDKTAFSIHILDTMGELNKAYAISDIAIIGGSFYDFGGHNPLEAAFYEKPIIIGNYNRSCADTVHKLHENHAIIVSDEKRLAGDILSLYRDSLLRTTMGKRAKEVLDANANSLQNHLREISRVLDKTDA